MPGLKREAGEIPAWSRHCNWQDLTQSYEEATGLNDKAGKVGEFVISQEPGDLPSAEYQVRFAVKCMVF